MQFKIKGQIVAENCQNEKQLNILFFKSCGKYDG
jgi:hypothetical protein